jgi:hypothetical protein
MNRNQIGFHLDSVVYHKVVADKLAGFNVISQGFLEGDMGCPIQEFYLAN